MFYNSSECPVHGKGEEGVVGLIGLEVGWVLKLWRWILIKFLESIS